MAATAGHTQEEVASAALLDRVRITQIRTRERQRRREGQDPQITTMFRAARRVACGG
jgi:hypothetical protein